MKRVILIIVVLKLTSCAPARYIEFSGKVATLGVEVSQKGIDSYKLIQMQSQIQKNQRDRIKILQNPNPNALKELPDTEIEDFSSQIVFRVDSYKKLLKIYEIFDLISDKKYQSSVTEAVSEFQKILELIDKIPKLSPEIKSMIPGVTTKILQGVQAGKIKQLNEKLFWLTNLYCLIWEEDVKIWEEYIDAIYDNYRKEMNIVDNNNFDSKKIANEFKEPFREEILVFMYRIQIREKILQDKENLKKEINDFGKSLRLLNKTHLEISKNKTNISNLMQNANAISNSVNKK